MEDPGAIPRHSTGAPQRIEIITGHERRRSYSDAEKARMVAETLQPGGSVNEVARRNGVSSSLLYCWRRHGPGGRLVGAAPPHVFPVRVSADEHASPSLAGIGVGPAAAPVEITLPNGCMLRVDQTVDAKALRRIIAALRG